jgi:FtsZ-binding cell division protein ZapB
MKWLATAGLCVVPCLIPGAARAQDVNATQSIPVNNTRIISELDDATQALREANQALEEKVKLLEKLGEARDKAERHLENQLENLKKSQDHSTQQNQELKDEIARWQAELRRLSEQHRKLSADVDQARTSAEEVAKEADKLRNKRSWLRPFAGIGVSHSRPPRYTLVPRSPTDPTLVIRNERAGGWTIDVVSGIGFVVKDSGEDDKEQLWALGPHVGFGGPNPFENLFVGGFFKISAIFFHAGLNFHREAVLQEGFQLGDALNPGQNIPTVEQWRVFVPYVGVGIDVGVLADLIMLKKDLGGG